MLRYRCYRTQTCISLLAATALTAAMFPVYAYASEPAADGNGAAAATPTIEAVPQQYDPASAALFADVESGDMLVQQDGLNFLVGTDGTATFVGWSLVAPTGTLQIPNTVRMAGQDIPVAAMNLRQLTTGSEAVAAATPAASAATDAQIIEISSAAAWLAASDEVASRLTAPDVTSIMIPAYMTYIDTASLAAFPNAKSIVVDAANTSYSSYNGMLFNSDLSSLHLVPEGMEGNAVLPADIATVPACVFSRCTKLSAISFPNTIEELDSSSILLLGSTANSAFCAQGGLLYSYNTDSSGSPDGTLTLVAAPSAVGVSVRLADQCTAIAEGALWGCKDLQTIQSPGAVLGINTGLSVDLSDESLLYLSPAPASTARSSQMAGTSSDAATLSGADARSQLYAVQERLGDPTSTLFYAQVPAFLPSTVQNAIVATIDDASHKQAWEVAGFSNFAEHIDLSDADSAGAPGGSASDNTASDATDVEEDIADSIQDGFSFAMLSDGTLSVTWASNDPAPAIIEIPQSGTIDGMSYTVSQIAPNAFVNQSGIESVSLPLTITSIGESAFARCGSLKTVALNSGLTHIGPEAFRSTGLEGVVIPGGVQYIGSKAFGDLRGTDIVAPALIPIVNEEALSGSTDVHVYVPYNASGNYAWSTGVVATGNRLCPYGVRINPDALTLSPGQSAELFGGEGYIYAPGDVKVTCLYNANNVEVDEESGTVTALHAGSTDIEVSLSVPVSETSISRQTHMSAQVNER